MFDIGIHFQHSCEMRSVLSIDDLSRDDIELIFVQAHLLHRERRVTPSIPKRVAGLIFLEPSLRTRIGFAAAAGRLGWHVVEVAERRQSPTSSLESWSDTLRTVAGYSDVVVARPAIPLGPEDISCAASCALINAGDVGPSAEHPSQALIDVFAIEELVGPVGNLRVAIVGDPRMRAVRSLLRLLARRPPLVLAVVADQQHLAGVEFPPELAQRTDVRSWEDLQDMDVVYIAGIPHGALPLDRREALLATAERVQRLRPSCTILSPMPVIDEMDLDTRRSGRNRMFQQSDLGLFVRMALLQHITEDVQ